MFSRGTFALLFYKCLQICRYFCPGHKLDPVSSDWCVFIHISFSWFFRHRDLKLAVIRLYEREILPLWDIFDIMHLSRRTFFHILKLWCETGDIVTHKYGNLAGRPRILNFDDIHYVLQLVRLRPDWFLDELLELLKTNRFISIHYITIHRELQRAGVSYKKLKHIASERNEEARNDFIACISQYELEETGFLDETSKNNKTATQANGRTKKGHRAIMKQCFVRGTCLSVTALLKWMELWHQQLLKG